MMPNKYEPFDDEVESVDDLRVALNDGRVAGMICVYLTTNGEYNVISGGPISCVETMVGMVDKDVAGLRGYIKALPTDVGSRVQ